MQSQVKFNKVPVKVLGSLRFNRVPEKVPKGPGGFGAEPGSGKGSGRLWYRICGHLIYGNPEVFPTFCFVIRCRKIYKNKMSRLLGTLLKFLYIKLIKIIDL